MPQFPSIPQFLTCCLQFQVDFNRFAFIFRKNLSFKWAQIPLGARLILKLNPNYEISHLKKQPNNIWKLKSFLNKGTKSFYAAMLVRGCFGVSCLLTGGMRSSEEQTAPLAPCNEPRSCTCFVHRWRKAWTGSHSSASLSIFVSVKLWNYKSDLLCVNSPWVNRQLVVLKWFWTWAGCWAFQQEQSIFVDGGG